MRCLYQHAIDQACPPDGDVGTISFRWCGSFVAAKARTSCERRRRPELQVQTKPSVG